LTLEAVAILIYAAARHLAASVAATKIHWFQRASGCGMIVPGLVFLFSGQPEWAAA
jgi:hypothetical protein